MENFHLIAVAWFCRRCESFDHRHSFHWWGDLQAPSVHTLWAFTDYAIGLILPTSYVACRRAKHLVIWGYLGLRKPDSATENFTFPLSLGLVATASAACRRCLLSKRASPTHYPKGLFHLPFCYSGNSWLNPPPP